ncbi:iron export ABC transporter permease subunit FetB [Candidimonas sp. SYP-B2681]|uniref:ABC transporter permease n=1 Tax=Candidimonas sp. SYP-B2681 TaxID=2497686 RepID=UPI000F895031|nr:iron export ABC transporter permease subunit FetB [Candidimonas sp. SYP-B2681]RTZ47826.1 iron export ABC transporter permease subunit FetB [Candidimonas sp. SYP-B2681]
MTAAPLSYLDLSIGAFLIILNAGLSLLLNLGLGRALFIAALRATVQLLLVGLVLKTVFALASPIWVLGIAALMTATATYEVWSRQKRRFAGPWGVGVGAGATVLASVFVTSFALLTLRPEPWYRPEIAIPLVGIVLGSVMNGVSISLNAFNTGLVQERAAIEAQLALGAGRYTALKPLQRNALRSGLIPIVNQMSAAGIITLPGMMTGQILAGMAPLEAAKYQILVLFLLSGGAGLGALVATYVAVWRCSDERDRLRLDRLYKP